MLARLHVGESTAEDAKRITYLHLSYYEGNSSFINDLKNNPKTMWLYAKNEDKDKTNVDMLIQTPRTNKVPVARLSDTTKPIAQHHENNNNHNQQFA